MVREKWRTRIRGRKNMKRRTAIMVSNDPQIILSYGVLAKQIITETYKKIDWNIISQEIQYMPPEYKRLYTRHPAGKDTFERDSEMLPDLCNLYDPEFVLTIGDMQNFSKTRQFLKRKYPWIHYLPIDNHDPNALNMSAFSISQIDIPVCMSKFGYKFCSQNGLKQVDRYIYPMVKTRATEKEKEIVKNEQPGWTRVHLGYRKVYKFREKEEWELIKQFKDSLEMPKDSRVLLFVGRPGWRKNIQFLLSIVRKLIFERERNVVLYMHTDVDDPSSTVNILKELHAHGIPEDRFRRSLNFRWYKGFPFRALNCLYNIADIQIAPHGGEGFGIPLAEGLATKVPFVATDCTTTPELSGNGKWSIGAKVANVFLDRGILRPFVDLEDFCDKVEYLLDRPQERKRMGNLGRRFIQKECDPTKIGKEWMDVFELTRVNKITPKKNKYDVAMLKNV